MNRYFVAIGLLLSFGSSIGHAGEPDPRFEGVWVGSEMYKVEVSVTQNPSTPTRTSATIVIGPGAREFGVLEGLGPGRYAVHPNSNGTKVFFKSHLSGTGRTSCTLILSPDGNTITETGFGLVPGKPYAVSCTITGTFHRKAKK